VTIEIKFLDMKIIIG